MSEIKVYSGLETLDPKSQDEAIDRYITDVMDRLGNRLEMPQSMLNGSDSRARLERAYVEIQPEDCDRIALISQLLLQKQAGGRVSGMNGWDRSNLVNMRALILKRYEMRSPGDIFELDSLSEPPLLGF